ncbi:hypothetical protein, partial [Pseudomonas protegens]|uniref:hypothetical protein n=1 Tax=Pseudomonas protegens TaxID=380021 RepID=UPI002282A296
MPDQILRPRPREAGEYDSAFIARHLKQEGDERSTRCASAVAAQRWPASARVPRQKKRRPHRGPASSLPYGRSPYH